MKRRLIVLACLALTLLSACAFSNVDDDGNRILYKFEKTYYYLDTQSQLKIYYESKTDIDALKEDIESIFERFDKQYNSYASDSVITDVNNNAYKEPYKVSDEMFEIVSIALDYAKEYPNAYDPTIMPLSLLWDINSDSWKYNNEDYAKATNTEVMVKTPPTEAEIAKALEVVGYQYVVLDSQAKTIFYKKAGVKLDLGGIVKGYIASEIVDLLGDYGVKSAIVNIGNSSQILLGKRPDEVVGKEETTYRYSNNDWYIGLEEPKDPNHVSQLAVYRASDLAISNSGKYLKYFDYNGVRYHHIFNPSTGYPVENDLVSVCIFTDDYKAADALSTMLFCIGKDQAIDYINSHDGVDGYLITDDKIYISKNDHEIQLENNDVYSKEYEIVNY